LINRLKANHYNLGVSLKRKGYTDNEECECGWSDETLEHVIWRCARFDEERMGMDERMRRAGITEDIDIWRVIENKRWNVFDYIYNFVKRIKGRFPSKSMKKSKIFFLLNFHPYVIENTWEKRYFDI